MDPHDNQYQLLWMGFAHLLYVKTQMSSNSLLSITPSAIFVNPIFKGVGDPYRIRTDVNGVRGRCLNHLTNGPLVHLQGLEPGTH